MSAQGTCNSTKLSSSHSTHPDPSRTCKDGRATLPLDLQAQEQKLWEAHTVFAEASVIPGTVFDLRLRVNVQEWTFLVTAFPCTKGNTLLSQWCRSEIKMTLKTLPGSCSSHRAVTNICKFRHKCLTDCLNLHEELQGLTPGQPSSTRLDDLCFLKTTGELNLKEQSWK